MTTSADFDESSLPPLPRIKLDKILGDVGMVLDILPRYYGRDILPSVERLANTISCDLNLPYQSLLATLMQYGGQELKEKDARILAHQLAGRRDEFPEILVPFTTPMRSEWVALEIMKAEPGFKEGKAVVKVELMVYTGHPAGHKFTITVPEGWFGYLMYNIAFSRRREWRAQNVDALHLRFWGWLPESDDGRFNILSWNMSNSMRQWNREIVKRRLRFDLDLEDDPCPYNHSHECRKCGVSRRLCVAAYVP